MATPGHHAGNSVTPDTLITIKISVNDSLKKLKLPLKDLGANVLIDKLRHCLSIKPEQQVVFERFSDSAGGYIVLEPSNQAVFKTLIRAAKAKSKLRLKATVTPDFTEQKTEEAELSQDTPTMPIRKDVETVIVSSPSNQTPSRDSTALDGRSVGSGIFQFREARASQQTLVEDDAPVPRAFTADRSDFFNNIARASAPVQRELAFRSREPAVASAPVAQGQWSVYCNNCDVAMYDAHYHCSICDGGDYDLCESCIAKGTLCPGDQHWLIKRSIKDGKVVTSTTERIGRKIEKPAEEMVKCEIPGTFTEEVKTLAEEPRTPTRTCNNCVYVLPENEFVTCTTCDDFDLCIPCHTANRHGHHPAHGLKRATDEMVLTMAAEAALAPGRHVRHNAICDGCDKTIYGIRHKCLDCPDWDYCSSCVGQASLKHARHRFTAIYTPIAEPTPVFTRHAGIYCDGPLCKNKADQTYITGVRYKCAVCHDTDFCASCEALPGNHHNRTHPLIKFKTPVKNVSITTMNEDARGHVRNMGDRALAARAAQPTTNAASEVKTVAEIKPEEKPELKEEKTKAQPIPVVAPSAKMLDTIPAALLSAAFVKDSIPDGMIVSSGTRFTQIWTLKNDGAYAWPAGCSVRFVGGDNMLNVDNSHPSSIADIADASESNVIGREVQVGEEIAFKLTLKAPLRDGKAISYWRVKAADGTPFGHRLWCDIEVKTPNPAEFAASIPVQQPESPKLQDYKAVLESLKHNERVRENQKHLAAQHAMSQAQQQAQMQAMANYEAQRQAAYQSRASTYDPNRVLHPVFSFSKPTFNQPQQAPATQQPPTLQQLSASTHTETQKENAKSRVEQVRNKIIKARAERHKAAVAEAKAKAVADKKSAEEDAKVKKIIEAVTKAPADENEDLATSQMVFPKLDKESPEASVIQSSSSSSKGKAAYFEDEETEESSTVVPVDVAPSVSSPGTVAAGDDFEDFTDLEVLSADELDSEDDGFLTDEEYDILDASDQETVASK